MLRKLKWSYANENTDGNPIRVFVEIWQMEPVAYINSVTPIR